MFVWGKLAWHIWVSFWPAPTVRAVSFVDMDQRAYTIHRTECLSRQNPSLIRRKNPAKSENDCISRNERRIKSTEPNLMILVSFSSAEDALSNDVKKYITFRMQGTENPPFRFFWDTRYSPAQNNRGCAIQMHILVHILVCALTAAFLDGFLSNFVWRCMLLKSRCLLLWWRCTQCSVFYRVKGHVLVHILVCALTAAFRDGFLSNFVWRCILVKSRRLLFFFFFQESTVHQEVYQRTGTGGAVQAYTVYQIKYCVGIYTVPFKINRTCA